MISIGVPRDSIKLKDNVHNTIGQTFFALFFAKHELEILISCLKVEVPNKQILGTKIEKLIFIF